MRLDCAAMYYLSIKKNDTHIFAESRHPVDWGKFIKTGVSYENRAEVSFIVCAPESGIFTSYELM